MRPKAICLALLMVTAATGLAGCQEKTCSGACAPLMLTVAQGSAVVKIVADPPCMAQVFLNDAGVRIYVAPQSTGGGDLSCHVYEWLSDGTELTAEASFSADNAFCCEGVYDVGTLSSFVPLDGGTV